MTTADTLFFFIDRYSSPVGLCLEPPDLARYQAVRAARLRPHRSRHGVGAGIPPLSALELAAVLPEDEDGDEGEAEPDPPPPSVVPLPAPPSRRAHGGRRKRVMVAANLARVLDLVDSAGPKGVTAHALLGLCRAAGPPLPASKSSVRRALRLLVAYGDVARRRGKAVKRAKGVPMGVYSAAVKKGVIGG